MTLQNGSVTNRTGAAAPVRACYGVWNAATATNCAGFSLTADGSAMLAETNVADGRFLLPDDFGDYIRDGLRLPAIRFDQEEIAAVGDLDRVGLLNGMLGVFSLVPLGGQRRAFYQQLVPFDSGNPVFMILDGTPVLLTVWSALNFNGCGTSVAAFKADINQLMDELGGGYQLTEVDLSGFAPLP